MLLGTWELSTDDNGRLILPPTFLSAATAGLTITRGFDRCLHAFPRSAWAALTTRVGALPLGAEPARHMRRLLFGAAADLALDAGGGLRIPRPLLAYAEISAAAVLVGMETYFEIWSPATWQAADEQLLATVGRWRSSEPPPPIAGI